MFLVKNSRFEWLTGEDHSRHFALPSGWSVLRCLTCGSPLPQSHDGERTWVIAGLMDDELETDIKRHIFCSSRADWDRDSEDVEEHDTWPG